jgi:hypothetical protein
MAVAVTVVVTAVADTLEGVTSAVAISAEDDSPVAFMAVTGAAASVGIVGAAMVVSASALWPPALY